MLALVAFKNPPHVVKDTSDESSEGSEEARCWVPYLLSMSLLLSSLGSGLIVKFLPLFFIQLHGMSPAEISLLQCANSLCGGCCNKTFGLLRAGCWPWQDQCLLFSGRDPIPHLHVKGFDAVVVVGSLHHTRKPGQCSIPLDLVDSDGLHALHATRTLEQRALGALHVVECERRAGWGHCGPAQLPVFLPGVPNDDRRRRSVCPTPAQRNGTELQP